MPSAWPAACASSSVRRSSSTQRHPRARRAAAPPRPAAAAVAATSCGVSARARSAVVACRRLQAAVERRALERVPGDPPERLEQLALGRQERAVRAADTATAPSSSAPASIGTAQSGRRDVAERAGSARELACDRSTTVRRSRAASGAGRSAARASTPYSVEHAAGSYPQAPITRSASPPVERVDDPAGAAERPRAVLGHGRADVLGRDRPGQRGRDPEQRFERCSRAAWSGARSASLDTTCASKRRSSRPRPGSGRTRRRSAASSSSSSPGRRSCACRSCASVDEPASLRCDLDASGVSRVRTWPHRRPRAASIANGVAKCFSARLRRARRRSAGRTASRRTRR